MLKKMLKSKKFKAYFSYGILFVSVIMLVSLFIKNAKINDFMNVMEDKTFDLRQSIIANSFSKNVSDDIILVNIDDASYEYLIGRYGEWPIPRNVYAQFIDYVEKQNPSAISFDLMFVKSLKAKDASADIKLVESIKKYDNVYSAMNFDFQDPKIRKPIKLDKKFTVQVENDSKISYPDIRDLNFSNCRSILPEIMEVTPNVGLINVSRSNDGILRKLPPFLLYQKEFFPHLALLVGLKYLRDKEGIDVNEFYIDKNAEVTVGSRKIPIDMDGGVILNWYSPERSFKSIPFYEVLLAAENGEYDKFDFKNKIIYVGVTTLSMYDVKSVPVAKLYPGVAVHATYINNLIDNNFIKKVPDYVNIWLGIVLALFVGVVVLITSSTITAIGSAILTIFGYLMMTYYVMKFFNLWIAIILPLTFVLITFITAYVVKYIIKSRDFEHQYKLATTDGLTELYNHRYFQEQMIMQVANSKRYNSTFSLILIDIDFFKKFNDDFGHQSGDAVLRQVAQKLKKNVRSTDFVCRYGGEEMSIILPNSSKDEAIITAQKICQTIAEKPFRLANDKESNVTISLGVATFPEDGETPGEIINMADKRLYHAKENGRNQVGF